MGRGGRRAARGADRGLDACRCGLRPGGARDRSCWSCAPATAACWCSSCRRGATWSTRRCAPGRRRTARRPTASGPRHADDARREEMLDLYVEHYTAQHARRSPAARTGGAAGGERPGLRPGRRRAASIPTRSVVLLRDGADRSRRPWPGRRSPTAGPRDLPGVDVRTEDADGPGGHGGLRRGGHRPQRRRRRDC